MKIRWQSADRGSFFYSADALEFLASVESNSVDCVWTDPPYLLSNDGITCASGEVVSVNKGDWDRSQGLANDREFHRHWIKQCYRVLKPNGTLWVSGTVHVYLHVGTCLLDQGFRILNDIVWEKPNPPPNLARRCFTHSTEMLLWATKAQKGSAEKYTFNYHAMRSENFGRQMKTVWRIPPPPSSEKKFGRHPTQKPLLLVDRCLKASTHKGDIVLDPFMGSGTTAVAALRLGRRFIGSERDDFRHARASARKRRTYYTTDASLIQALANTQSHMSVFAGFRANVFVLETKRLRLAKANFPLTDFKSLIFAQIAHASRPRRFPSFRRRRQIGEFITESIPELVSRYCLSCGVLFHPRLRSLRKFGGSCHSSPPTTAFYCML